MGAWGGHDKLPEPYSSLDAEPAWTTKSYHEQLGRKCGEQPQYTFEILGLAIQQLAFCQWLKRVRMLRYRDFREEPVIVRTTSLVRSR